jgi:hypothetical protein
MFSGPPPTTDIGERDWHVSVVPIADIRGVGSDRRFRVSNFAQTPATVLG